MNRLVHILFTIYFTLVSSGVLYSKHYCGTSVSHSVYGISLGSGGKCGCSHDKKEHDKDCCKSETKILKTDIQKTAFQNQFKVCKPLSIELFGCNFIQLNINFNGAEKRVFTFTHPPPKPPNPLFILNQNLLI